MTKCHLLLLCAALLLLGGCKHAGQGSSLSEYGSRSLAGQAARFEQYVMELAGLPLDEAMARQEEMLTEAEGDSAQWQQTMTLQEKFFLDPNSPYRNEELYIPVVDHLLASPHSTEAQRDRAGWLAPRVRLNRLGTVAADFPFRQPNGRTTTLHQAIDHRHPQQTLLFFSNPGCPNCKEITEALAADPAVAEKIASGTLLVVNVYPDEDVQAWLDYLPNYPDKWICGHDDEQILHSDTCYWLRAIPSLYLLDKEKRVVLKDAPLEKILSALTLPS